VKIKVTITMDEDLVPEAKRFAKAQGLSLSQLIENTLRSVGAGSGAEGPFSKRWRGKFSPSLVSDERYKALEEKYK